MKICVAQTKPVAGDIDYNLAEHLQLVDSAAEANADLIVFPELSLTGYEPTLARKLAIIPSEECFRPLQQLSSLKSIIIAAGMPIRHENNIHIGMIIFQPHQPRVFNYKKHLHPDEFPYFTSHENQPVLELGNTRLFFSICYELTLESTSTALKNSGADIYVTSVAKSAKGSAQALPIIAQAARDNNAFALYSNCTGICDGTLCDGRSSVWDKTGNNRGQLDDNRRGILLIDTHTGETVSAQW